MLDLFATGAWLSLPRLRRVCRIAILAYAMILLALFAGSDGRRDRFGRALMVDFSQVWVAGLWVDDGRPGAAYDNAAHAARQAVEFGPAPDFLAWTYPPFALPVAGLLARLPYAMAALAWQGLTLPVYLAAIAVALPRKRLALVAALAFPAAFVNLEHGQNGFLSAGLMGLGLALAPRRPGFAGLCLGLLAFKPQFALVPLIALGIDGRWRALGAAALTLATMAGAAYWAYGPVVWQAFFHNLDFAREVLVERGAAGWSKMPSAFAAMRQLGGSVGLAYGAQSASAALALIVVARLARRSADGRLRAAAAMAGALLVTPYSFDYDIAILGPALALLAAHGLDRGFAAYEISLLAFAFAAPLAARGAGALGLPLGLLATLAVLSCAARRRGADAYAAPSNSRQA